MRRGPQGTTQGTPFHPAIKGFKGLGNSFQAKIIRHCLGFNPASGFSHRNGRRFHHGIHRLGQFPFYRHRLFDRAGSRPDNTHGQNVFFGARGHFPQDQEIGQAQFAHHQGVRRDESISTQPLFRQNALDEVPVEHLHAGFSPQPGCDQVWQCFPGPSPIRG